MKKITLLFLVFGCAAAHAQQKYQTLFESTGGKETPVYGEVISYFSKLADDFEAVHMEERGMTDSGEPLHLLIFDQDGDFDADKWHEDGKFVLFINNGIHPGEPDGIDASMMLVRDLALGKVEIPKNTVLALIPVYNIGGHLNRSSVSRVNQNGPEAYGFRANARNYDLNRDFIKGDTRNAQSFQEIFHWLRPHVFIDTHVSNGADYQHVMTLISTQHNRLGGELGEYLEQEMEPVLYNAMKERGYPLIPYVNAWGGKPEDGWPQFKDNGRYSSGYAALFNTLGFMPETHMLKPYELRVASTYALFESFLDIIGEDGEKIIAMAKRDKRNTANQKEVALNHIVNRDKHKEIEFHGYRSGHRPSDVSGLPRLYYDREQPFTARVKFFNEYVPGLVIEKPKAYVIPQGWHPVIDNLRRNGVYMEQIPHDTLISVTQYHIMDFNTSSQPYEGHYIHSGVEVVASRASVGFRKGDYIIPLNQEADNYIVEVLEPQGEDGFFVWNFFDTILQRKEGYSAYVFEDLAAEYLRENPKLLKELEEARKKDKDFANDSAAQLRWVYERSPWKEKEHNRYPVFRLER